MNPQPRRARRVDANIEHTPPSLSLCAGEKLGTSLQPKCRCGWTKRSGGENPAISLPWDGRLIAARLVLMTEPNQALGSHDRPFRSWLRFSLTKWSSWIWGAKDGLEPSRANHASSEIRQKSEPPSPRAGMLCGWALQVPFDNPPRPPGAAPSRGTFWYHPGSLDDGTDNDWAEKREPCMSIALLTR